MKLYTEYTAQQALNYAYLWMKKRKLATAQVWACICFEKMYPLTKDGERNPIPQKDINDIRNNIIHNGFIKDERKIEEFFEKMKKKLKYKQKKSPEEETELQLILMDRIDPDESVVEKFNGFLQDDIDNEYNFERKLWSFKYMIDEQLKSMFERKLETGLMSELSIESEWVWLPIGLTPMLNNERVKKPVISLLFFRNEVRIYAEITTLAVDYKLEYYSLIEKRNDILVEFFDALLKNKSIDDRFFNVKHYSIIDEKNSIKISDWINNNNNTQDNIQRLIGTMRKEIEKNKSKGFLGSRNNILLFGNSYSYCNVCEEGVRFIDTVIKNIKDLAPFLEIIQNANKE